MLEKRARITDTSAASGAVADLLCLRHPVVTHQIGASTAWQPTAHEPIDSCSSLRRADDANHYSVSVTASGGFESLTGKHDLAQDFASKLDRQVEVLHIGDHDPSGGHIFVTLMEDVGKFVIDVGGQEPVDLGTIVSQDPKLKVTGLSPVGTASNVKPLLIDYEVTYLI